MQAGVLPCLVSLVTLPQLRIDFDALNGGGGDLGMVMEDDVDLDFDSAPPAGYGGSTSGTSGSNNSNSSSSNNRRGLSLSLAEQQAFLQSQFEVSCSLRRRPARNVHQEEGK